MVGGLRKVGIAIGGGEEVGGLGKNGRWIFKPPWWQLSVGVGFNTQFWLRLKFGLLHRQRSNGVHWSKGDRRRVARRTCGQRFVVASGRSRQDEEVLGRCFFCSSSIR